MNVTAKTYLGDGAYVEYQGYTFVLTTDNGLVTTNEIYLELGAMKKLIQYAKESVKGGFNE